jgi:GNAT superfamily N-acetyltransferase
MSRNPFGAIPERFGYNVALRRTTMTQQVTIRKYKSADFDQILDLVQELESELAEKFQGVKVKSSVDDYRNRYLEPTNKYKTFVALVGGRIIGFLLGYPSLGAPEIDTMYDVLPLARGELPAEYYLQLAFVSKPYRNRGISTRLHERVIAYAKEKGFKEVYACIAKWNNPELRVVRSLKFQAKDLRYRYRLTLKI